MDIFIEKCQKIGQNWWFLWKIMKIGHLVMAIAGKNAHGHMVFSSKMVLLGY